MKVILREKIDGVGKKGEVLNVKTGFARNFLIPSKKAYEFSSGNQKKYELDKKLDEVREVKNRQAAMEMLKTLAEVSITVSQKAHDDEMLYGSVTNAIIAKELEKSNVHVDKNAVLLEEPIKKLGFYNVQIKLHPEVTGEVKVWVVKDE
ncbi:TPA: 50S ribosomal protein L9 [candidate division WOR-3 bacterium]|jgi:large subunit ribosomal protein L9|uniref:Large ribosomal subunit protein bL9 n=1 Tax=candidate division WOR-3 bacterium TaxID=2052148 RepID=A0A350H9N5_UNCW3|nr:50S ribosomal protein L9 [candidate division WOR-3 bacterium]